MTFLRDSQSSLHLICRLCSPRFICYPQSSTVGPYYCRFSVIDVPYTGVFFKRQKTFVRLRRKVTIDAKKVIHMTLSLLHEVFIPEMFNIYMAEYEERFTEVQQKLELLPKS